MIEFHYEIDFQLNNETRFITWLKKVVNSEDAEVGELNFIFCSDEYLLNKNQQFLDHDTYTDIISFDYSEGKRVSGDIFISLDRLKENSVKYSVEFEEELLRVMGHGVLHFMGYNDKSPEETKAMRLKENEKINMFHVEH